MSAVLPHTLQDLCLQYFRNLPFTNTHLNKQNTEFLRLGNLIIPPVITMWITMMPILQALYYLMIQIFILIIGILWMSISKYKVIQPIHMNKWHPVSTIPAGIIYIYKTSLDVIIQFQSFINIRIFCNPIPNLLH